MTITSTNSESTPITAESVREAVKNLQEIMAQPFALEARSSTDLSTLLPKSVEIGEQHYISALFGITIFKDDTIPPGIIRFKMSDGSTKDIPVTNQ